MLFWTLTLLTFGSLFAIGPSNIVYFVLYFLFYKFSGAHNKPTSDDKYDPSLEHQNNPWHKMLRKYESTLLNRNRRLLSSPVQNNIQVSSINSDEINPELFHQLTHGRTRPLIIRGLFSDSTACKTWNQEFFTQEPYAETKLRVLKGDNVVYKDFTQKIECEEMELSDAVRSMANGDTDIYINNVTKLFLEHPDLVDDIGIDDTVKRLGININTQTWLKLNAFIGQAGTRSSLHCAAGGNLFFLASGGKKEWTFISPEYIPYFKTTPAQGFTFAVSGYDIDNLPDTLRKIPQYKAILEPGDALYNPPWWLHDVKNLDDFTIGVAIRDHTAYSQCFTNCSTFTLMSSYWWRLNPLVLWGLKNTIGLRDIREKSMQSDIAVTDSMTK